MRVVVSYDISCDRSRTKVAGILEAILTRVQFSVFEGEIPRKILKKSIQRAIGHIDPDSDSIRVYRLCAACAPRVDAYGRKDPVEVDPVRIL